MKTSGPFAAFSVGHISLVPFSFGRSVSEPVPSAVGSRSRETIQYLQYLRRYGLRYTVATSYSITKVKSIGNKLVTKDLHTE